MMEKIIREKSASLTLDQFVQEMVLGKIASDIYNQAKLVAPLRHVGIRKSKLIAAPTNLPKDAPIQEAEEPEDAEETEEEIEEEIEEPEAPSASE